MGFRCPREASSDRSSDTEPVHGAVLGSSQGIRPDDSTLVYRTQCEKGQNADPAVIESEA